MTIHNPHTSGLHPGGPVLYDECPRCQEHAKHPENTLDRAHLNRLREFWEKDMYRSRLDEEAAKHLFGHIKWPDVLVRSIF